MSFMYIQTSVLVSFRCKILVLVCACVDVYKNNEIENDLHHIKK